MKKTVSVFLSILIFLSTIFGFIGCAESVSNEENTSGVTINFNGATLHGKGAKSLNSEDIAPYVGMPIQEALAEMDFGIDLLERNGFVFRGWTKTKNGDDYVSHFPTFGTIYAKWIECVNVTFNLNGGYLYDDSGNKNEIISYAIPEDAFFDSYLGYIPYRDGFTFIGWTTTKNGEDLINQPNRKQPIVYAKWQDNLRLFEKGDIIGDFASDGEALNYEGEGIYTYEFVYDVDDNAWGSREKYGEGVVSFKLRPKAGDWSISYGSHESLNVDKYSVEINQMSGEGSDVIAYGLVEGTTYTIKIECNKRGYCALRIYTGGNILNIGGDGDCIFTLDAGKAYFAREDYYEGTSKGPKKLTYKFTSGTSLAEIISSIKETVNDSLYVEYTDDYKIPYSYEEDGSYYVWREEIQDKKGNIISIDSDSLEKEYLSSSTTYTLVCRKLVSIVCDFNGGAYYSQDSMDVISTAGDSLDFDWIDNLYKDGYVFGGWTLTPNGEDYVTAIPDNDTILYASWCYVLTIDAGKGTFVNKETGEEYKTITKKFTPGTTRGDVWSSIHAYGFGEWVLNAEEGQFVLEENKNSSLDVGINYEEDGISYAFNGCFDEYGDEIFEFIDNDALKPDTLLETNTSWYFQYVQAYCVTYNLNGGTYEGSSDSISFYERSGFSIERSFELAKDRCIFKGWMLTQDGEDCIDLGSFHLQEDVTFYAKWVDAYVLTLDAGENKGLFTDENGNQKRYLTYLFEPGKSINDIQEQYGEFPTPSDYYSSDGEKYGFLKYYQTTDYKSLDAPLYEDQVLEPSYYPYVITTLYLMGGEINGSTDPIEVESVYCAKNNFIPVRDGYVFKGWCYYGVEYKSWLPGDILYAVWALESDILADVLYLHLDGGGPFLVLEDAGDGICGSIIDWYDYMKNKYGEILHIQFCKSIGTLADKQYGGTVSVFDTYVQLQESTEGFYIDTSKFKLDTYYKIIFKSENGNLYVKVSESDTISFPGTYPLH